MRYNNVRNKVMLPIVGLFLVISLSFYFFNELNNHGLTAVEHQEQLQIASSLILNADRDAYQLMTALWQRQIASPSQLPFLNQIIEENQLQLTDRTLKYFDIMEVFVTTVDDKALFLSRHQLWRDAVKNGDLQLIEATFIDMREVLNRFGEHSDKKAAELFNAYKLYSDAYFIKVMVSSLVILFIALGVSLWVSRYILYHLNRIQEQLKRIAAGDYRTPCQSIAKDEFLTVTKHVELMREAIGNNIQKVSDAEAVANTANHAKSIFLANMSHEIRTPLNGVIGMSAVLSETKLTSLQRDYLTTIETSSSTLLALISDILDLSKIESNSLHITPYVTYLLDVLYDSCALVKTKAKENNTKINVNMPKDIPYSVMVDDHRLRQVLMNLLSNAVKFTQDGTVSLNVNIKYDNEHQAWFTFAVNDTGIGIAKEKQIKIFAPFKQEYDNTCHTHGGTGLGLAISQQLVELMGGELQLDSEKGKGSCFFFSLPIAVKSQQPPVNPLLKGKRCLLICDDPDCDLTNLINNLNMFHVEVIEGDILNLLDVGDFTIVVESKLIYQYIKKLNEELPRSKLLLARRYIKSSIESCEFMLAGVFPLHLLGSRLISAIEGAFVEPKHEAKASFLSSSRVLVVEDNRVNQKVVQCMLAKLNVEVLIANNGEEGAEAYISQTKIDKTPTVILMDCMMPVLDGFGATERIRQFERENHLPETPIIALTASVLDTDIQRCFDSGMTDYLAKPLKMNVFVDKVSEIITADESYGKTTAYLTI